MDKAKIKKIVKNATYLSAEAKKEWLTLIASANEQELAQIEAFFVKAQKAQTLYKFKIAHKFGLGKEYSKKIKEISNLYTKNAIRKSEESKSKNNPEQILKKLDKL